MMVEMIIGENDNDEKVSSGLGSWGRWGVVYGDLPFPGPNCLVPDVGNAMINIWDIVFEFIYLCRIFPSMDILLVKIKLPQTPFISNLHTKLHT